jgi:SAM-dependent methyltransferase
MPQAPPPDFVPAPNLGRHPDIYELENEALARDGRLDAALQRIAPWAGRRLLDVGCGSGFWLPRYAVRAGSVRGVEPDPALRARADERVAGLSGCTVHAGSAEHLGVPDASVDVAHARFAYFFGPGAEAGLAAIRRALASGGVFVAIDNAWTDGAPPAGGPFDFEWLLRHATGGNASIDPAATAAWWAARGAERVEVRAGWQAPDADTLTRILGIEFPAATVSAFRARHCGASVEMTLALSIIRASEGPVEAP